MMPSPHRIYLGFLLEGSREDLEAVSTLLFQAGCLGTEEIGGATRQRAYFPAGADIITLQSELAQSFPALSCGPVERIPDRDWLTTWKESHHGFPLGDRFYVLPSWEPRPETDRIILTIDPERAFGTGSHDTTRMCLELVEEYACPGAPAIDAGAGTGILAIAAAALGCRPVLAVEADPEAASCARSNVERNGASATVCVAAEALADVRACPSALVVANLNEPLLNKELPRLCSWVRPKGVLIVSGLLLQQVDCMEESLPPEFELIHHRTAGEWVALVARRDADARATFSGS